MTALSDILLSSVICQFQRLKNIIMDPGQQANWDVPAPMIALYHQLTLEQGKTTIQKQIASKALHFLFAEIWKCWIVIK